MFKSQLGRKYWPSRATEWDLSVGRGLRDRHPLVLRDCRQRVLFLVFGLCIFLSGERNCSVTRSVGEAPSRDHSVCRGSWASLPKQLPWQPPTLRKSQSTSYASHPWASFSDEEVGTGCRPQPGPVCASVSHSETWRAHLPPLVRSSGEMAADRIPHHTFPVW